MAMLVVAMVVMGMLGAASTQGHGSFMFLQEKLETMDHRQHQMMAEISDSLSSVLRRTTREGECQPSLLQLVTELEGVQAKLQAEISTLARALFARGQVECSSGTLMQQVQQVTATIANQYSAILSSTRSLNKECYVEDEFYVMDDCTIRVCTGGQLRPYQGAYAAPVPVHRLEAKGCLVLETRDLSFSDARSNCRQRGGDLFVPGDFMGALQYLQTHTENSWVWVGVSSRKWLDGREVGRLEWRKGEPNGDTNQCGWMTMNQDIYGVTDDACTSRTYSGYTRMSLCQKGVSYP